MRKMATNGPYRVTLGGFPFWVLPNVYAPCFFSDTAGYARVLPSIVANKVLLEIGTGIGAIAAMCAQNGAKVIATDINPDAVQNAKLNFSEYGLEIEVRQGNIYDPILSGERFDVIFWAHPFNGWNALEGDMLLRSGVDPNYSGLRSYIRGAHEHLREGGSLLLGSGDSADWETINGIAYENGYEPTVLSGTLFEENKGLELTYFICELSRRTRASSFYPAKMGIF